MRTKIKFGCFLLTLMTWLSSAKGQQPVAVSIDPPTNTVVRSLTFIYVFFGDNVQGVDASDLLINGVAATNVIPVSPAEYLFYFPPPPTGAVSVAWAAGNGIMDTSDPPNAFAGGSWSYTLDPNSVATTLIISEFLTDNASGIKDEDGARSDWIEIYNPGPIDANLGGWFLTDSAATLTKWRFPSVFLGVNQYLLVWASSKDRVQPGAPLHTNFKLSKESGYLALVDPTTNIVSEFDPYPPQESDISYGRDRVDPNLLGYFTTPTPRAQNSSSGPGFAPEPVFSLDTGIYTNTALTLTISAPLGTIRYTVNGTVPASNSPVYTGPITFGTNVTIKARVFPPSGNLFPSAVVARNFIFLDSTAADFTSKLPTLIISTEGRAIPSSVPPGGQRVKGSFVCIDTFRGRSSIHGAPEVHELAEFETFGQTSEGFPKQPIRIEIQDALSNDLDKSLLGMPADADWRLRNPYNDKTYLNDFLGFELWEKMGHYSVRRKLVEVFLDKGGGRVVYPTDYYGVMVLTETIKVGGQRVDISKFSPQSTNAADFIVKRDKDSMGDLNFNTAGGTGFSGIPLKLHEPKPNELRVVQGVTTSWPPIGTNQALTPSGTNQMLAVTRFLNQMETSLYSSNWLAATGTNHYSYYLDTIACADQMLHVEFTKQIDGYRLSDYWTRDQNGKFGPGPVWDWNLAYGNANYLQGGITNTWYYDQTSPTDHLWPRRLITGTASGTTSSGDPNFVQLIADRWAMFRTNVLNGPATLKEIDDLASLLTDAAARDLYGKYRNGLIGVYTWPNPDGTADGRDVDFVHPTNYFGLIETKVPALVTGSIVGQMKKWVMGRYLWMDSQFTRVPTFTLPSGMTSSGTTVVVTPPPGSQLYYTLDGTDPRASGGGVIPGALSNAGPVVITVTSNIHIVARAKAPGAWKGTFSGPGDVSLYTAVPRLRITEIMYHPQDAPGGTNDSDFEYIELKNIGNTPLNLNGYRISGGVDFTFPNVVLNADQRILVVANQAAFTSRYGAGLNIAGQFTGNLENAGERLVLEGHFREPILDFKYSDKWYPITDGFGFSLVVVDENAPTSAWGTKEQWRSSGVLNGTPGQADGAAPVFPQVVINEALTHSDPPPPTDTIELRNLGGTAADISGWYLTDDFRTPKKYRIPNGTTILAGGYVTFNESQFNTPSNAPTSFALGSTGDEVYLFSADPAGNLTGYQHGFAFGAAKNGVTFGRYVDSINQEHFVSLTSVTLGSANSPILIGPVVITEIMYRPPDIQANGAYWNNSEDEFVELRNISGATVNLYDAAYPANRWKLDNAVEYTFPANVSLPAGGYVLVVNFDPVANPDQLSAFRSKYGVSPSVPVFGPYGGSLDNGGDDLRLYMPDTPEPTGPNAGTVPYVLVDRVHYSDQDPWPVAADGMGHSLQRINQSAFGDDPMNWAAGAPTLAAPFVSGSLPAITQNPTDTTVVGGATATFSGQATGPGPIRYSWRLNGEVVNGATNSVLMLPNAQGSQSGQVVLYALNPFGAAMSAPATLTVLVPLNIDAGPATQDVREGTNVTLSVVATSAHPPITYQWRFNGTPIPGATNASYTITSVTEFDDGVYDVLCTDGNGTVPSGPATLRVLILPTLLVPVPPLNLTAVIGDNVTLSARTRGTKPIWTVWRRFDLVGSGGNIVTQRFVNANTDFLTFTIVNTNQAGRYSMLMTNVAGGALNLQRTNTYLTILADTDGDHIPDIYETANGLNPNNPADATTDSDGDTMSNRDEYIAGTNPNDINSYLKVGQITATGTANIDFVAVSNRTYSVLYKDNISGLTWSRLADVVANGTNRVERVTDPAAASGRIYRLVTPKQP